MNGEITEFRRAATGPAPLTERIAALLGEIEGLSRRSDDVPAALLIQTRATLERARCILKTCAQLAKTAAADEERQGEADPQPEVDNDVLDPMYRKIGNGRQPP